MQFEVRRVHDAPGSNEGRRVLVDRLWPRGVAKAALEGVPWVKSVAPSDGLRRWFDHDPAKWAEFKRRYFAELYANVEALRFEFHGFDQVADGEGYLRWTMYYRHPRLRGGAEITVEGCSHLLWRERVYRHRDYFDAGALLYEHLPVMGCAIRWLKGRLV